MYSDQPMMPSSVVILRKELTRQPASQCSSSILTIFIAGSWAGGKRPASCAGRVPPLNTLDYRVIRDNFDRSIRPLKTGAMAVRGRRKGFREDAAAFRPDDSGQR